MLYPSSLSCALSALRLSTNHSLRTCAFVYIKVSADRYRPLYSGWITKKHGQQSGDSGYGFGDRP